MPVFLPQLSRRDFLKRAALAGAGIALAPHGLAAVPDKPRDPDTFAFFSDAHIAASPADKYLGVNMSDHLAACAWELAAWPVRPATVIVNGDLAYQMGKPGDYTTFGKLIEPVRGLAPVYLTLGNHDEREHFREAFPADAMEPSSTLHRQATVFGSERANWFLLDTLDATDKTPGELGGAQLDWLAHELDSRPDKPAIIVLHHNPQFATVTTGLKDTAALMAVLAPRHHVKLAVFGHTHDWRVSQHESGIHLVNLPPTAYVFKTGRPSGWVRATLAADGAEFELRSLDPKHPEHAQVYGLKWRG
ncbi:MAG: metallophosphoesterase [Verrucomicrobiota bacterium]|jgi:3',5'-cyclic-AMP phosphodiesterase